MIALQALSIAEVKPEGSGALIGDADLSVAGTAVVVLDENTSPVGGAQEDHFQP